MKHAGKQMAETGTSGYPVCFGWKTTSSLGVNSCGMSLLLSWSLERKPTGSLFSSNTKKATLNRTSEIAHLKFQPSFLRWNEMQSNEVRAAKVSCYTSLTSSRHSTPDGCHIHSLPSRDKDPDESSGFAERSGLKCNLKTRTVKRSGRGNEQQEHKDTDAAAQRNLGKRSQRCVRVEEQRNNL